MTGSSDPTASLTRFEKGQIVRVRPLRCNSRPGESGVVLQVKLDAQGLNALDKYVVSFEDKDQQEFWRIQLD
jgi:hypothetical protein